MHSRGSWGGTGCAGWYPNSGLMNFYLKKLLLLFYGLEALGWNPTQITSSMGTLPSSRMTSAQGATTTLTAVVARGPKTPGHADVDGLQLVAISQMALLDLVGS